MNSPHRRPIRSSSGFQFAGPSSIADPGIPAPTRGALPRRIDGLISLGNWTSERGTNHLLGTPGPTDVLLRFVNRYRQVVPTPVSTRPGARRTSCNPVPPRFSPHLDVVQDVKLPLFRHVRPPWHVCEFPLRWFAT